MEEHRSGAASARTMRAVRRAMPAPAVLTPSPAEAIAYVGGCDGDRELAQAIVGALVGVGVAVCFGSPDVKAGRAIAQATGAQHYPYATDEQAMEQVRRLRGRIDYIVAISLKAVVVDFYGTKLTINRVGHSDQEIAGMVAVITLSAVRALIENICIDIPEKR